MATETFENGVPPEVAPVRRGEDLPWDRLQSYLAPLLGTTGAMTVMQFPNGSANLTYLLTFGDQQFVLRRPPFGSKRLPRCAWPHRGGRTAGTTRRPPGARSMRPISPPSSSARSSWRTARSA